MLQVIVSITMLYQIHNSEWKMIKYMNGKDNTSHNNNFLSSPSHVIALQFQVNDYNVSCILSQWSLKGLVKNRIASSLDSCYGGPGFESRPSGVL